MNAAVSGIALECSRKPSSAFEEKSKEKTSASKYFRSNPSRLRPMNNHEVSVSSYELRRREPANNVAIPEGPEKDSSMIRALHTREARDAKGGHPQEPRASNTPEDSTAVRPEAAAR